MLTYADDAGVSAITCIAALDCMLLVFCFTTALLLLYCCCTTVLLLCIQDAITCIAASDCMLLVGRESGTVQVCSPMLTYARLCSPMHTYAHVCSRALTYAPYAHVW